MQTYLRKRLQRLSSQHVPHRRPQPNRVVHGRWLLASCAKPSGTRCRSPGIVRRSENGCAYARAFQVTHPDPLLKQLSREAPPGANFFRNPVPMKRRDVLDEEASLYEGLRRALEGGVKQWYKHWSPGVTSIPGPYMVSNAITVPANELSRLGDPRM